jgi:S-adenosylmethionine:tRNA ribosyltransferase-isomerase
MLVASFVGVEKTHELYEEAIRNNYRFYSYGDAMLII